MKTVDAPLPAWRRRHGVARRDMLLVTPFDQPNRVLVLEEDARVDSRRWQVKRRLPPYVFLYLDRSKLLAARLRGEPGNSTRDDTQGSTYRYCAVTASSAGGAMV